MPSPLLRYEAAYNKLQAVLADPETMLPAAPEPTFLFVGFGRSVFQGLVTVDMPGTIAFMESRGAEPARLQSMGVFLLRHMYDRTAAQTSAACVPYRGQIFAPVIELGLKEHTEASGELNVERLNGHYLHELHHLLQPDREPWY